jgi:hypothetical protein
MSRKSWGRKNRKHRKRNKKGYYFKTKFHKGKPYRGMGVGGVHKWNYPNGKWTETKVSPRDWLFTFVSRKQRRENAPYGSGAPTGSKFLWKINATQITQKVGTNTYSTWMKGKKTRQNFIKKRNKYQRIRYDI